MPIACADLYTMLLQSKGVLTDEETVLHVKLLHRARYCGPSMRRIKEHLEMEIGKDAVQNIHRQMATRAQIEDAKYFFGMHRLMINRELRSQMNMWTYFTCIPRFVSF